MNIHISELAKCLVRPGATFNPLTCSWIATSSDKSGQTMPADSRPVDVIEAVRWVLAHGGGRKLPVGVIGPRDASPVELQRANDVGAALARTGFTMICGGRSGAMEAACRGHAEAGGVPIGILPEDDWRMANDFVAIPLATGFGEARNAIIASSSFAIISVGGGYGTLSEMALGLRLDRLVVAFPEAHVVDGAVNCTDVTEAMNHVCRHYLGLKP